MHATQLPKHLISAVSTSLGKNAGVLEEMSGSEEKRDSKVDMGETVLLSAPGEKEDSEGRSASRWAEALLRLSKEDQTQFELAQSGIDDPKSVLSNVLTATNKRKEECMKKRWKLVIKGQTIIIRDVLEKLSNWIQKLLVCITAPIF